MVYSRQPADILRCTCGAGNPHPNESTLKQLLTVTISKNLGLSLIELLAHLMCILDEKHIGHDTFILCD